jgi:hypothetical protein
LSKTLDYYADAEVSEMTSSSDESINPNDENEDQNIVTANIKIIVVVCSM